jgi:hypothetical protein
MHTHEAERGIDDRRGLGESAKRVADSASAIARLEIELAAAELKQKLTSLAVGIGLAVAAAVLVLYALGFGLAAAAAGLATQMSTWAALLIVTGALIVIAVGLALIGRNRIKRGRPVPEEAIREAKLTTDALKSNGNSRSHGHNYS